MNDRVFGQDINPGAFRIIEHNLINHTHCSQCGEVDKIIPDKNTIIISHICKGGKS